MVDPNVTSPARAHGTEAQQLLARVLLDVETLIPYDRGLIWLLDEDGRELRTIVGRERGAAWNPHWSRSAIWPMFAGALEGGNVVMLPPDQVGQYTEAPDEDRHFLVAPIRDEQGSLGILSLTRGEHTSFTRPEVRRLESVAGLASVAVHASVAIDREREQRRAVAQMGILTANLNQARTPGAVVDALLHSVAEQVGVKHSYVVLFDQAGSDGADVHLAEALRHTGATVVSGLSPQTLAVEEELSRTLHHVSGSRFRALLAIPPVARPDGMHGLAAVPIRNGDRLPGALYLWSPVPPDDPAFADLPDRLIDTAETLCAQAAVALDRTTYQQLAEQVALEQRTLATFSSQLNTSVTSSDMAHAALRTLASLVTCTSGRVTLAGDGATAAPLATWPATDPEDSPDSGALYLLASHVEAHGTGWDGPLHAWQPGIADDVQVLCWPVASDAAPIGTLTLARCHGPAFTSHEIEIAAHAADQLALGLQRARSHDEAVAARYEAERYAEAISRLLTISNEMSRQPDLEGVLSVLDRGLLTLLDVSSIEIYCAAEDRHQLERVHARVIDGRDVPESRERGRPGPVDAAARQRRSIQETVDRDGRSGYLLGIPMVVEGRLRGVVALGKDGDAPFTEREISLLGIFGTHMGSELSRIDLARRNRDLYLGGIRALTSTVDAKDPFTRGHSARVGRLARLIAEELALPRDDVERVELAGLLHDVGKVAIPDAILQKDGPLDKEERAIMMGHSEMGAHILRMADSDALHPLVPLVLHHHEWWDGRGYPHGLREEAIPVGALIIAVADAFDTMTHDRPYRKRSSVPEAWQELVDGTGTQFSPDVVAVTRAAVKRFSPSGTSATPVPDRIHQLIEPLAQSGGQLGDLRSLGILVGLAQITSHMTDLPSLVEQALAMIAERLDITPVLVLSTSGRSDVAVRIHRLSSDGYRVETRTDIEQLDARFADELPVDLASLDPLGELLGLAAVFQSPANTGVVPLRIQNDLGGMLIFEPRQPSHPWRTDLSAIETIAPHVSAAVNVARMHQQAKEDARTDGLTDALNYRAFQEELAQRIGNVDRFSVLMFDVVGLKPLNDTIGHLAGDQLLRHAVDVIRSCLTDQSVLGRIGGDEFGALLVGPDARSARAIGRRIVAKMEGEVAAAYQHTVSLRFGWSAFPEDGRTADFLLHAADQRMYLNRPSGRDRRVETERP